jgi:membrane protein implicated in regulation of membrane protease activity
MAPPLLWLILASLALVLVVLGADTDGLLLVLGLSGLVLVLATSLAPALPTLGQLCLFVVLSGTGYWFLRRWSSSQGARAIAPSASADQAEVIAPFDGAGFGRVRWQGQSWAALNLDPAQGLAIGDRVTVLGREGTRLQVLSREGPGGWLRSEGDQGLTTGISQRPWS